MTGPVYTRRNGEQTLALLAELFKVYQEVYAGELYSDDPIFSREQFMARTTDQARREGFELVTLHADNALAGFSFGLPFSAGRWWAEASTPPEHILQATKFAVIELGVKPAFRGQGWGKALLDTLLSQRPEAYATLATIPESPAQAMYQRWGWYKVGVIGGEGPLMDAMVGELQTAEDSASH